MPRHVNTVSLGIPDVAVLHDHLTVHVVLAA